MAKKILLTVWEEDDGQGHELRYCRYRTGVELALAAHAVSMVIQETRGTPEHIKEAARTLQLAIAGEEDETKLTMKDLSNGSQKS
jgi:hypothetical protein